MMRALLWYGIYAAAVMLGTALVILILMWNDYRKGGSR